MATCDTCKHFINYKLDLNHEAYIILYFQRDLTIMITSGSNKPIAPVTEPVLNVYLSTFAETIYKFYRLFWHDQLTYITNAFILFDVGVDKLALPDEGMFYYL